MTQNIGAKICVTCVTCDQGLRKGSFFFGEYQEGDSSFSRTFVRGKHRIRLAAERKTGRARTHFRVKKTVDLVEITIKRDKGGWVF